MSFSNVDADRRYVAIWLTIVCVVVYLMIGVGGVTRLTQSGLSMVDWRPIMGIIPPLNKEQWMAVFDAYRQFPEYQKINRGMSLDEFKYIFYWEYGHRVLGRIIGLLYFLPLVAFITLKKVPVGYHMKLWVGLLLGGLQGLMGWYMVKSGLVDKPHVSHFRLAAHLMLAIVILAYLSWLIMDLLKVERRPVSGLWRKTLIALSVILVLQLIYGAFTAGLDAGRGFNSWPLMYGQFLADAAVMMSPFWLNFFENGVMIQFVHRWVGALFLAGVILNLVLAIRAGQFVWPSVLLVAVTLGQFLLGVVTLVMAVPVVAGSLHQAVACLVVLMMVYLVFVTRDIPTPESRAEAEVKQ